MIDNKRILIFVFYGVYFPTYITFSNLQQYFANKKEYYKNTIHQLLLIFLFKNIKVFSIHLKKEDLEEKLSETDQVRTIQLNRFLVIPEIF